MIKNVIFCTFVVMLGFAQTAHAYIDPGSGSMVLQVIIAVLAGIICAVKIQWTNLKLFVNTILRRRNDDNTNNPE